MESVSGGPPSPPVMPPPVFAAPVAPSLYRQAFRIVKSNRRPMLLPLLVTQVPVAIAASAALFILLWKIYPETQFDRVDGVTESAAGLGLSLMLITGIYGLFTLVGLAATVVASNGIISGKRISLSQSLDPAFTRMGGLLGLILTFYSLMFIVLIGIIPALFFVIRFGLSLHAFIIDSQPLGQALRTSWTSLRGRTIRFSGYFLSFAIMCFVALTGVSVAVSLSVGPFISANPTRIETIILLTALGVGWGFVFVPLGAFIMTTMTLFYLREKKGNGNA